MVAREYHYRWEWKLASTPAQLWPLVADTNRFNKDTGLPPLNMDGKPAQALPNARRRLGFSKLGFKVEWEEEPFQWVEPHTFSVVRRYSSGPVKQMRVLAELNESVEGGTLLTYQVWAQPRNVLGLLAIPIQIGVGSARSFAAVFRGYDRDVAAQSSPRKLPESKVQLSVGGRQRLERLRTALESEGAPSGLLDRLIDVVEREDDLEVSRLRPYALADAWGADRRQVLELCLLSTRVGLLAFEWDLLCPLCRGAKVRSPSLGGIQPQVHCDTCKIDFAVNFEQSVELTFSPNPSVRRSLDSEFCVAGPRVTPHVAAQQLLASGDRRRLPLVLEPGRYRIRTLGRAGGRSVLVAPEAGAAPDSVAAPDSAAATVELTDDGGWETGELRAGRRFDLEVENNSAVEELLIFERLTWSDQATTAAEVTALQRFRDLFAGEALRPGERFSVGSMTILFTDLCGSTRMYNEVGDAPAFGLVMNHFDLLIEAVQTEGGALVKTIGDAVMAVFTRPLGAVRATLKAQRALARADGALGQLRLKAGMHFGPCIAVTLNDKLDYFGSTVNIAARLEHLSEGNDLVISSSVRDDPEVVDFFRSNELVVETVEAILKGFDEESFQLARLRLPDAAKAQAARPAQETE